jgi:dTDP-4-amino-4,6-dideoxygalactose transaminase
MLKKIAKFVAQQGLGRLPRSEARIRGPLKIKGGTAVRDIRFRPWADYHSRSLLPWFTTVRPRFRSIFCSGVEGLPQSLQQEFSRKWAAVSGCKYALMLPHGTDALRFALAAMFDHDGLDYGGEVIVPNYSFIASATAPLDRRFGIALVDVEPDTLLLDARRVEEAIIPGKTRAIMPVHLFGQPCNMAALRAVAGKHQLKIIEDAAQAHGAALDMGPVGALGDAAGFSFQSHKNISCGEGGVLTTNDETIFERAYGLHNVGRARIGGGRWEHLTLGWNCRPTEYQAALLLHRLTLFEAQQAVRRKNFDRLRNLLADTPCLQPLAIRAQVTRHSMYMFPMRYCPDHCGGLAFEDFLAAVQAEGAPIHRAFTTTVAQQPAIAKLIEKRPEYVRVLPTPVSEKAAADTAYIAHNVFLGTAGDMEDIAAAVHKVQSHFAKG